MMFLFAVVFLSLANFAFGTCVSYGIDFVNGGSYFIDSTEATDFTFLSQFEGCTSGEEITPILVDPNEDEYFCSQIATTPDDTSILSTCPILQTDMFSGTWYIVIEGLTFAYVRTFTLTVGVPTTTTAIPTITVGMTSTPDVVTTTSLSISTGSTIIAPSTVTIPCKTTSKTTTVTPSPVFTTTTRTITITKTTKTISTSSTKHITSTATCTPPPFPRAPDPRVQAPLILPHGTVNPHKLKARAWYARDVIYPKARGVTFNVARNAGVVKRGPDEATVTVTETTFTATTTSTTVLEASTVVQTEYSTTIETITPSPVTKCSGVTKVTFTSTASTKTFTRLSVTKTTIYATKTVSVCHTIKTTTTPKALQTSCIKSGGSM
ncbi:hypothetical protein DL98DRAFT_572855 [Cadophora sp. DSE1049]|nr:hypothetical protein DL98DRAFT_572855 [Cadophora sp. DSE1049]